MEENEHRQLLDRSASIETSHVSGMSISGDTTLQTSQSWPRPRRKFKTDTHGNAAACFMDCHSSRREEKPGAGGPRRGSAGLNVLRKVLKELGRELEEAAISLPMLCGP